MEIREAFTFDDVLLVPAASRVLPASADTAAAFGIEPRVAMLSYSTGESGSGADVDKVKEAVRLARELRPDLALEGPIQYDAAVDAYLKAIQTNPNATGPFYNMGIAYKKLGQYERAAGAFEAAHRLEPDNLNVRLKLGNVYNLMENWEKAVGHLNYVVHRDPENAEAYGNLGWALYHYNSGPPFKMLVVASLEKAVRLFEQQGMKEAAQATRDTLEQARQKFGYGPEF